MLSKCTNPDCSETFRYLHLGKIFCLAATPEIQAATETLNPVLEERFWLCERCSKEMTLVWGGTQVKLVRLLTEEVVLSPSPPPKNKMRRTRPRARAASPGREDV
ncbi:MAG: hypothetical protein WA830_12640 [Candidatus Sulfotelmatobacter sp.]